MYRWQKSDSLNVVFLLGSKQSQQSFLSFTSIRFYISWQNIFATTVVPKSCPDPVLLTRSFCGSFLTDIIRPCQGRMLSNIQLTPCLSNAQLTDGQVLKADIRIHNRGLCATRPGQTTPDQARFIFAEHRDLFRLGYQEVRKWFALTNIPHVHLLCF